VMVTHLPRRHLWQGSARLVAAGSRRQSGRNAELVAGATSLRPARDYANAGRRRFRRRRSPAQLLVAKLLSDLTAITPPWFRQSPRQRRATGSAPPRSARSRACSAPQGTNGTDLFSSATLSRDARPLERRTAPNNDKSAAMRGLRVMRRRGLEPPPGYPGPGPQSGDPGVISVRIAPERPCRDKCGRYGRIGRSGCSAIVATASSPTRRQEGCRSSR
jgi:hypothetical protein